MSFVRAWLSPYIFVIILAGQVEGGEVFVAGPGVNGCTVPQEELHHFPVALEGCRVKRSEPPCVTRVHQEGTTRGKLERS